MKLISNSFSDGQKIPGEFAFCVPDPVQRVTFSKNLNPHFAWSGVPAGTLSFALICIDPDVPSKGDDVNQAGKTVPANLPRVDFFHWTLFDLPPDLRQITAGQFSSGVTPQGKSGPQTLFGARHGLNDYTNWFAGHEQMDGQYYGYDGPCPPWNDEIPHRYQFTLYALNVEKLSLGGGKIDGAAVMAALKDHILDKAVLTGTYALNPQIQL